MTVLVLSGSHRKGSHTRQVAELIARIARDGRIGPELDTLPFFSQDLEHEPPAAVARLRNEIDAADRVVFVTPEYNGAVPGVLANALDWMSRPYGAGVLADKAVVAESASPGDRGGERALAALCGVLGNVGAVTVARAAIPRVDASLSGAEPDEALIAQLIELVAGSSERGLAA